MTVHNSSKLSQEEMEQEDDYFRKVISRYSKYQDFAHVKLRKMTLDYNKSVPEHHKRRLGDLFTQKLLAMKDAIATNQNFINQMIEGHVSEPESESDDVEDNDGNGKSSEDGDEKASFQTHMGFHQAETDMDNVCSSLRQFIRDWSAEGQAERESCYGPILKVLDSVFSPDKRGGIKVLVPGSGLGRLAYEIAQMGFVCQGNEFSYYMLIGSEMMLNRVRHREQYRLCPYALQVSNVKSTLLQTREIAIPDIVPDLSNIASVAAANEISLPPFSMVAGDFLQVYADQYSEWDVVVTCFFMDTAKNPLLYMDYIHRLLKPGGRWINFGRVYK